ncbi:MAG: NADH-quinone oxidoreductase subunit M [Planctomycetota bacterium]|nr:MAG: NADH-quinone oxidoreductase subunit M [Planctomycetota bacterium]
MELIPTNIAPSYWLSVITFLPLVGAFVLLFLPRSEKNSARWVALLFAVVTFLVSLKLWFGFELGTPQFQFVEQCDWITFGKWKVQYFLGVDGISLLIVLLTTFLTPIVVLSAWKAVQEKVKEYMIFMLLLETAMLGALVSLDLFLFYVFWELMLIPMYFLIGIYGSNPERRRYAAIKFFIFTMVGSVFMLIGIIYLGAKYGGYTFSYPAILDAGIDVYPQMWLFLAFAVTFAIKVPMFPFHTWLPDAHTEAPTGGSVILAGILLKMGTYGFVRFAMPLFPDGVRFFMPALAVLAVIGIIYGALVAMVQPDVKRLVAFSSVSHLGYVMLGLFALNAMGVQGGIFQMISHGLSTGALFLIVGMIYERRHTRMISEFGGLAKVMPVFAACFLIVTLSSIGLPSTNGFVGEFLILIGAFTSGTNGALSSACGPGAYWFAIIAALGVIFGAVYMLWMFQRVMYGKVTNPKNENLKDLSLREFVVLAPIILFIFIMGIFPTPFLRRMEASVKYFNNHYAKQFTDVNAETASTDAPEKAKQAAVTSEKPGRAFARAREAVAVKKDADINNAPSRPGAGPALKSGMKKRAAGVPRLPELK